MAETVKTIDARTMTDADGSTYWVVFCARKSDNIASKPGHAFVVWGVEDASAARSRQEAFGFYPDSHDDSNPLFGSMSGEICDEASKAPGLARESLWTARLIVQVNKPVYNDSIRVIEQWRTSDYSLYKRNCIHFAHDVAVSMGLLPPEVGFLENPTAYMLDLIERAVVQP
jgi:hypothetical protein